MAVIYGSRWSRITTCAFVLLPVIFAFPERDKQLKLVAHKQRSLNSYVATSVPYLVDHRQHVYLDELSLNGGDGATSTLTGERVDGDDDRTQEMLDCVNANHCANSSAVATIQGTFKPYSQDELNKILQKYENGKDQLEAQETTNKGAVTAAAAAATNYYSIGSASAQNAQNSSSNDSNDKLKTWNRVNQHSHNTKNPPYDDRLGWVTLEPVPWSSSQVQKWEPNSKPNWPLPPSNNGPWGGTNLAPGPVAAALSSAPLYQQHNAYGVGGFSDHPYKKPTYQYQPKPWSSSSNQNYGRPPPQFSPNYGNDEIITDGQPGYFPLERPSSQSSYKPWLEHSHSVSYTDGNNRPASHGSYQGVGTVGGHGYRPPDREPGPGASSAEGDGHWVLLSSTKGYSVPHTQRNDFGRSLYADAAAANSVEPAAAKKERPISARRSVRLTILPSLDGPKATVISHNGMIERDANDQTVEEAHREHLARMMRFGNSTENEVITRSSSFHGIPAKVEAISRPADRRNAVLKTVSAGVIPATMAVLLPMLLGRRKRSIVEPRNTYGFSNEKLENVDHFDRMTHAAMLINEIPF